MFQIPIKSGLRAPSLVSHEMIEFWCSEDMQRIISPSYHTLNNEKAESAVKIMNSLYKKITGDPIALGEALHAYHDTPVAANLPTPAQVMIEHKIISDLMNVDIHDKDQRITEERYQHKRRYIQDPRVVP